MVRVFPVVGGNFAQYVWRNFHGGDIISGKMVERIQVVGGVGHKTADGVGIACRVSRPSTSGVFYGSNPLEDSFSALLLDVVFVILIIHLLHLFLRPLHQPKIVSQILVRSCFFFSFFFSFPSLLLIPSHMYICVL